MNAKWTRLAVKRWREIAVTESIRHNDDGTEERRFTATICGYQNWRLLWLKRRASGKEVWDYLSPRACDIRKRIEAGDEKVFTESNDWEVWQ